MASRTSASHFTRVLDLNSMIERDINQPIAGVGIQNSTLWAPLAVWQKNEFWQRLSPSMHEATILHSVHQPIVLEVLDEFRDSFV